MNNIDFLEGWQIREYFDALDVGIHIMDPKGVTLYYNKAAEEIDGLSSLKMVGSSMEELIRNGLFSCSVGLMAIESKKTVSRTQIVNDRLLLSNGVPILKDNLVEKVIVTIRDIEHMKTLQNEIEQLRLENDELSASLSRCNADFLTENQLLSNSKAMAKVMYLAERMASVDSTVLIEGESGVGKGMVAKYIHSLSTRKSKPFVTVDCSSIPESLIESELFGYRPGSFTGALKQGKDGLVLSADGGTLFLDEIGELPLSVQAKLLRLIQEKVIQPIGASETVNVDVRIISATNWDLQAMVEKKMFRGDLYYRLRVVPILIPPLRYRKEDIIPLIKLFLNKFSQYYNLPAEISPRAMKVLLNKKWPGNVRELENEIERLVVTSNCGIITEMDVYSQNSNYANQDTDTTSESMKEIVERYEQELLLEYKRKSVSVREMANRAKMNESTLRKKAQRYGITLDFGNNSK